MVENHVAISTTNTGISPIVPGLNADMMQNLVLLVALTNILANLFRVGKIFGDTYRCYNVTAGAGCDDRRRPFYMGTVNYNPYEYGLRGRGPEVLCYGAMTFVHARFFKAVMEDDWDTISLWLKINAGLTALSIVPAGVFPSVWGTELQSDAVIGLFIIDILEYGIVFEYMRTKGYFKKKEVETVLPAIPHIHGDYGRQPHFHNPAVPMGEDWVTTN